MLLKDLIDVSQMTVYGDDNVEVLGLCDDSRNVKAGDIFFAIDGTRVDGKKFALEAAKKGAKVIVSKSRIDLPEGVTNVVCKNERAAMSIISAAFYGNPSKSMFVIGVTGTNGKTTITYMLEAIFKAAGKKVGVIGTNGVKIGGKVFASEMTTPDPIFLQSYLANMRDERVDVVCMEVSAHALELSKIRGVMTDIALFTNLTEDHLDFFLTMAKYRRVKESFFDSSYANFGVVNADDMLGRKILRAKKIPLISYSKDAKNADKYKSEIYAENIITLDGGQEFDLAYKGERCHVRLNLSGLFNVSNAMCAVGAALAYGMKLRDIVKGLESLLEVAGRFNVISVKGVKVVIDYAHTPDGLLNILKSSRQLSKKRVISVFGCGGNREKQKRPIMGRISEQHADYTFITVDNPRFEDPLAIAKEIEMGMLGNMHQIELSREKAIKLAIDMAGEGDVVVLSGKGAENYIDQMGQKTPYEDKNVVLKIKALYDGNN